MSVTLTATPDPVLGSVLVQVVATAGETMAGLTRTDGNGTASVRLLAGQDLAGGSLTVQDNEAALIGPVTYTFTDADDVQTITTTTFDGTAPGSWITVPVMPGYSFRLALEPLDLDGRKTSSTTVHDVIGRPYPALTLGRLASIRGRLQLFALTWRDARAIADAYNRGVVVMLRQDAHDGMDLYHVAQEVRLFPSPETTSPRRFLVEVDYVGAPRPSGVLLGTVGWDFDGVTDTYPDFDTVRDSYASFADLTAGAAS